MSSVLKRVSASKDKIQILSLLVSIQIATYWHYYFRITVPNGDVNAHYLSDGYYWWNNGGILNPPEWVSYAWMGRPGGSNIQDSSFVLPAGITNFIGSWTPTSMAVMSSVITSFGALGMYILVRRITNNHLAGLLGLVGQFFVAGIFSNAQFLDFHRGAAYLPWFMLLLSPYWYWEKRWSLPAASLILWQIFVGVYPGQLVVSFYLLTAWFFTWVWVSVDKRWVIRSVLSALTGLALAIPKYIPALIQGTGDRGWEEQRYHISSETIFAFFFPYGNGELSWDIALRSFFVVSPLIILAVFGVKYRSSKPALILGTLSLSLILIISLWEGAATSLPGLNLSRFLINDVKNFLLISILLLGTFGFIRVLNKDVPLRLVKVSTGCIFLFAVCSYLLNVGLPASIAEIISFTIPIVLIIASGVAIRGILLKGNNSYIWGIILISIFSGLFSAYSTTQTWASSRIGVEVSHYGEEISSVISGSECSSLGESVRRRERALPEKEVSEWWHDTVALRGAFDCTQSIGGYTNVPGNPTLIKQQEAFKGEYGGVLIDFFSAPGAIVPVSAEGLPKNDDACLMEGECGSLEFNPVYYSQDGHIVFDLSSKTQQRVILNESFYDGWDAQICFSNGGCSALEVGPGIASSISLEIPEGQYQLGLEYNQPYRNEMMLLFWSATLLAISLFWVKPVKGYRMQ